MKYVIEQDEAWPVYSIRLAKRTDEDYIEVPERWVDLYKEAAHTYHMWQAQLRELYREQERGNRQPKPKKCT